MALSQAEINKRFGKHPAAIEGPNPNEPAHALLREAYVSFVDLLNQMLPDSRDTSLSLTALEESSMWAHKAVGRQEYQVVDLGGPLTFHQELVNLINKHSLEGQVGNTADWVLGEFLNRALADLTLAFVDIDAGLNYAVVHYAERAVKTLDLAVRLRAGQSGIQMDLDAPRDETEKAGSVQVTEKPDGFHFEVTPDVELPEEFVVGNPINDNARGMGGLS